MQEQSNVEYIRKLKATIAPLPRKARIKRLEKERRNAPNRSAAKLVDELLRKERSGHRSRWLLKAAGWLVVLAAILFVLIEFGNPHSGERTAESSSRVSKSAPAKVVKKHKKHQTKTSSTSKSSVTSSSSSSTVAASSSSSHVVSSSSSQSVNTSSSELASRRAAASYSYAAAQAAAASSSRVAAAAAAASSASIVRAQQAAESSRRAASSYTIQNGDNLYRIAVNHGLTLEQLESLNGLKAGSALTPGQTLRLK